MSESGHPTRRAKRLLSAEQKYEVWLEILCGELTANEAAARAGVDRSTVLKLCKVAIAALRSPRPGRRGSAADSELVQLRADNAGLLATVVEQAIELAALRGKAAWG